MRFFRLKLFIAQWTNYEYWPWIFFYLPTVPFFLYYSIRSGYFFFNTAANPGIEKGGLFGESKINILDHFSDDYKPKTLIHKSGTNIETTLETLRSRGFELPFILKPDVGQRGLLVERINTLEKVQECLQINRMDYIIQEYIDYPFEFGVMYHRIPGNERGKVTSIVSKVFLSVTGDGKSTVEELLLKNKRAWFQMDRFKIEKPDLMSMVVSAGEKIVVEPIGNHCKGTEFVNSNHVINEELDRVFDNISKQFEGFYYGRFDLKVKSIEEFYKGETIRIFELNGVTSEPGHIYDKNHSLFKAYRDIIRETKLIYQVSVANIKKGVKPLKPGFIISHVWNHFRNGS